MRLARPDITITIDKPSYLKIDWLLVTKCYWCSSCTIMNGMAYSRITNSNSWKKRPKTFHEDNHSIMAYQILCFIFPCETGKARANWTPVLSGKYWWWWSCNALAGTHTPWYLLCCVYLSFRLPLSLSLSLLHRFIIIRGQWGISYRSRGRNYKRVPATLDVIGEHPKARRRCRCRRQCRQNRHWVDVLCVFQSALAHLC